MGTFGYICVSERWKFEQIRSFPGVGKSYMCDFWAGLGELITRPKHSYPPSTLHLRKRKKERAPSSPHPSCLHERPVGRGSGQNTFTVGTFGDFSGWKNCSQETASHCLSSRFGCWRPDHSGLTPEALCRREKPARGLCGCCGESSHAFHLTLCHTASQPNPAAGAPVFLLVFGPVRRRPGRGTEHSF